MRDFVRTGILAPMRRACLVPLLVMLGGCGDAPAAAGWTSAPTESSQGSTGTTGDGSTTAGTSPSAMGTSGPGGPDMGDGESGSSSNTDAASTGSTEPVLPPALLEATVTPDVLTVEGPIAVHAVAEHADGVRMRVDDGDVVELDEVAPGEFVGELAVFTALDNGVHDVVFTAWKGDEASPSQLVQYETKLQPAGSEAYWDASGALGAGFARSVAVDQDLGWVFEFGDLEVNGEHHCFVRRRGAAGEYFDADIHDVLAGQPCTATSITIADDGTLHLLAETTLNGASVWWLGRKASWDAPIQTVAWGSPGEKAHAATQHPDRAEVAVCGTTATKEIDLVDGMVAIFREDMPGFKPLPFDYAPEDKFPHRFGETLRDCAYDGDVLVLAGEANGKHANAQDKDRNRLLLIEYDTQAAAIHWTFAGPGPALSTQSGARALAITDGGTYVTFGYACEDTCAPQLHLREFLPGGVPSGWNVLPAVNATLATDVAWSSAGYVVIAAGKVNGPWWTEFWLQGWVTGDEAPVWSYGHLDQPHLHIALAIAIARFGRIYAVGVAGLGDLDVPGFAVVNP